MRHGGEHLATGARPQRRSVPRLLPVRVWRLGPRQHHTARTVAMGHVRGTAPQEPARHQEPPRYAMGNESVPKITTNNNNSSSTRLTALLPGLPG